MPLFLGSIPAPVAPFVLAATIINSDYSQTNSSTSKRFQDSTTIHLIISITVHPIFPLHIVRFYLGVKGSQLDTERLFCLSSSAQVLPLDVTTALESYAWNYIELATLLTLSESLAEGGFEPLIMGSK